MLCWKVGSPLAARFIRGFVWKELAYRKMLGLHFWLEERGNTSPSCFYSLVLDCVRRIYRGNQLSSSSAGAFLHLLSVTQADFEKRWFGFGCFTHSSAVVQICYCFSLGCSWNMVTTAEIELKVSDMGQVLWHELLSWYLFIHWFLLERMKQSFSRRIYSSFVPVGLRVMAVLDKSKC